MINRISRLSNIIQTIVEIKRGSDIFDYDLSSRMLMQLFQLVLVDGINSEELNIMRQLEEIMNNDDMILTSDFLIGMVKPYYENIIAEGLKNSTIEDNIQYGDYSIECTSSGNFTLKNNKNNIYLHSNLNPISEAEEWVRTVYDPNIDVYYIWGLGLGYHLNAIYKYSFGTVKMNVFYEKYEEYELACKYGNVDELPDGEVSFYWDKDARKFVESIQICNECAVLLHFPSILCIEDDNVRTAMHSFFSSWNSTKLHKNQLLVNFRKNNSFVSHNVDELEKILFDKDVIIVGGGPSLNNAISYLQNVCGKYIICATTVLGKLLQNGISPDYVVVLDPLERTMGHVTNLDNLNYPLILISTAFWGFARAFSADKYILYQKDYELSEKSALEKGNNIYRTGGTVMSMAIDIVGKFQCRNVEMIGVDLAFPENNTHASGTMDCSTIDTSGMISITDVNGGEVKTNSLFLSYKSFIEKQIRDYSNTVFINRSNCGAHIEGTIEKQLL